jgi:phytoene dehydrogenase-like protein
MENSDRDLDALVIGSGPNGLAAAITLAHTGWSVRVIEGQPTPGGGTRTQELTMPGFWHDVCSAIHPLAVASPFLRTLPLDRFGLKWIDPPLALAHPFDDRSPAVLSRSLDVTCASLGPDADAYRRWISPFVEAADELLEDVLRPYPILGRKPLALARFGILGLLPAAWVGRLLFQSEAARGLFAGLAAHSMLPLEAPVSSGFALLMSILGHTRGWPIPEGGSQRIFESMLGLLRSMGGELETGHWIDSIDGLPAAKTTFWDVTPRQLIRLAGECLPAGYRRRLARYRYGPGVFKLDLALDGPLPWKDEACAQAGTVHLGGNLEEIAASEHAVCRGQVCAKPFLILAQPSLFDPTRAPTGMHTVWVYCHVPNGSRVDMTGPIEDQIERFAPGFRRRILARHVSTPASLEAYNPNYVGGDINSGIQDFFQFYTRPTLSLDPYHAPGTNIYLCSSATPPGGGVHGLCGYWAARSALRRLPKSHSDQIHRPNFTFPGG